MIWREKQQLKNLNRLMLQIDPKLLLIIEYKLENAELKP